MGYLVKVEKFTVLRIHTVFLINEVNIFGTKKYFVTTDTDDNTTYVSVETIKGVRTIATKPLNDFNLPPAEKFIPNVEEAIALINVLELAMKAERKTVEQVQTEALLTKPLDQDRIEKTMHILLRKPHNPHHDVDPAFFRENKPVSPLHDPYLLSGHEVSTGKFTKNP